MAVQKSAEESHPQEKVAVAQTATISPPTITPVVIPQQTASNSTSGSTQAAKPPVEVVNATQALTADATPAQQDIWQRIRGGFGMRQQDSKQIARYEQWYASRPEYVDRMTERGKRYLYFIVDEVEKRGMPMEIALLPMIESAFNPGAYSSARASGIWQFIPSTGKNFGMQQNWWYDGRRDVVSATKGALDYLQKLHDQFGEWDLALAAYNCGENSVMRAQARNRKLHKPTDYASLRLPKETRGYVPKLMAVKNIVSYPESFGLTLTDVPNKPYFAEITPSRHIDVEMVASMAEISMEEFTALNPAHNRPVILKKEDEVILLPVANVDIFHANLQRTNQPLVSWQACPTKKGEDLDDLADRYGISIDKLKSVNGIHRSVKTTSGQTLLVPLNGEEAESEFTAFNTHLPPTDNSLLNAIRHTVRKGDTLSSIARRYHVKLSKLQSWNRGVKILRPGQHIMVAQQASQHQQVRKQPNLIKTSTRNKIIKKKLSSY